MTPGWTWLSSDYEAVWFQEIAWDMKSFRLLQAIEYLVPKYQVESNS